MKIIGVGLNYLSHQDELSQSLGGITSETEPIIFHKGDATLRAGAPFYIPDFTHQIDYEVEIVVKIGRVGKHIEERFAHRYYDEISVGIDFTARDIQREAIQQGKPWWLSKAFDGSAAVGRFVSKRELGYPDHPLKFDLLIDGALRQRGNSLDMIHSIDKLISYISGFHTLKMGDMIFTGTPAGVGAVSIGQRLEARLNGEILLSVDIK